MNAKRKAKKRIGLVTLDVVNGAYAKRLARRYGVRIVSGPGAEPLLHAGVEGLIWDIDHLKPFGDPLLLVDGKLMSNQAVVSYAVPRAHTEHLRSQGITTHRDLGAALRSVLNRAFHAGSRNSPTR
jgi:hypothetical protein